MFDIKSRDRNRKSQYAFTKSDVSRRSEGVERVVKYKNHCQCIVFEDTQHSGVEGAILDADPEPVFFILDRIRPLTALRAFPALSLAAHCFASERSEEGICADDCWRSFCSKIHELPF